jgi:hypothetical protein
MKRRSEFRSWLGFFNYHLWCTGFVFVRSDGRIVLKRIKTAYGNKKKKEVWKFNADSECGGNGGNS